MSDQVVLSFICTEFQVHERALQMALKVLLEFNGRPCSIETLAERICYSPTQTKRILRALAWHNPDLGIPPIAWYEGKPGVAALRNIDVSRVEVLGLLTHAA